MIENPSAAPTCTIVTATLEFSDEAREVGWEQVRSGDSCSFGRQVGDTSSVWCLARVRRQDPSPPDFIAELSCLTGKLGAARKPNRYFVDEGELIYFDGRTYALSNQWSGGPTLAAIDKIANAYPALQIVVSKSPDSDSAEGG
jgi:hypothetical protein